MARPAKSPEDRRNKPLPIKFSTKDLIKMKEEAGKEHLQVSTWIRKVILEYLNGNAWDPLPAVAQKKLKDRAKKIIDKQTF